MKKETFRRNGLNDIFMTDNRRKKVSTSKTIKNNDADNHTKMKRG